jgi:hypothetical protein
VFELQKHHRFLLRAGENVRPRGLGRRIMGALMSCFLGLAGISCASSSNYLYQPAENATAMTEGYSAARYAIPAAAPKGDVRIASFGVQDMSQDENGPEWPAIHVRVIVSNDTGGEAWVVDPREIKIEQRGQEPSGPAVVSADAGELPEIRIAQGEERTLDLFYPLGEDQDGASNIPAFDVLWSVHIGTNVVVERTPFERLLILSNASVGAGVGYSPFWWSNPWYYSDPMFMGSGLVGPRFIGPRFSGPGMMRGPAGGSRFHMPARPSIRR